MGITTTTTTTIVLVYSYYNYIPQFVFCSIIITKILLKIIPLPPHNVLDFSLIMSESKFKGHSL